MLPTDPLCPQRLVSKVLSLRGEKTKALMDITHGFTGFLRKNARAGLAGPEGADRSSTEVSRSTWGSWVP